MKRLQDIAEYVDERISSTEIELSDYVTTDCLLQNKNGRTIASNLPPVKCNLIKYQKNDILIANIRPYLKKIWYADRQGGASADVLVFRAKTSIDPLYLYAVFLQDSFYDYVMRATKGSKMPRGDKNHIMNYIIHPVSGAEEKRIGQIISNINTKIELNKKINRELETMAKELYDYWFVQFDFPDENGNPYRSSGGEMVWNETLKREIPEGWEVSTVGKTINKIPNTARVPSSEYLRDGLIPVIDQSSDFIAGYTNNPDSVLKSKSGYIVFGDHTRIVKYIRFPYARGADGTQVLKSNNPCIPEELFYQIIKSIDLSNYGYARHFKFLKDTLIVIPEKNISGNFAEITKPIYEKQAKLVFENIELSKLRDWLLPLLMNGQVRVSEEKVSSVLQKDDTNRFILWKNTYPVAARGEKNDTVLRAMYEAMDDEDK